MLKYRLEYVEVTHRRKGIYKHTLRLLFCPIFPKLKVIKGYKIKEQNFSFQMLTWLKLFGQYKFVLDGQWPNVEVINKMELMSLTVKPALRDHPQENVKVVFVDRVFFLAGCS